MEFAEATTNRTLLLLLDWEKAFDKIHHARMLQALERVGIHPNILGLIRKIYTAPKFRVVVGENASGFKQQSTGIRKGCPLSPYLFVIVMAVIFKDIKQY